MAAACEERASSRVVAHLRKLDGNVSKLKEEAETLLAEKSRWLAQAQANIALAPLPRKCQQILTEAEGHERRAELASRGIAAAEGDAAKWRAQREQAGKTAEEGVKAAEERRLSAAARIEGLASRRAGLEAEHKATLADGEAKAARHQEHVEKKIAEVRSKGEERAKAIRQQVAAESGRAERELEEVRAAFARQCEALDAELREHEEKCNAAYEAACQRCVAADEEVQRVHHEFQEQVQGTHADADGQVKSHEESRELTVAETNRQLEEFETQLEVELSACCERERAAREDHSAEEHAAAVRTAADQEVRQRKAVSSEVAQRCAAEVKRLTEEAEACGAEAIERSRAVQEEADLEIQALREEMEGFAQGRHVTRIQELQQQLAAAFLEARQTFGERQLQYQEEAEQVAREAGSALVAADRRVEEVRGDAREKSEEHVRAITQGMVSIAEERQLMLADAHDRFRHTQEQMLRYIGRQQEELRDQLKTPEITEVGLQLNLGGLGIPGSESTTPGVTRNTTPAP